MSLLRPPKQPNWLPRYSRPAPVGGLVFLLLVVVAVIWFLFKAA